jgi:hypothetical protein
MRRKYSRARMIDDYRALLGGGFRDDGAAQWRSGAATAAEEMQS